MSNFSKSLNKGVPVEAPIVIRAADLCNVVDDKERINDIIQSNFYNFMDFLNRVCPSTDLEYLCTMSVAIDEETLERKIIFSPTSGFFGTLIAALNLDHVYDSKNVNQRAENFQHTIFDIKDLESRLRKRIAVLSQVHDLEDLMVQFPALYNKYQEIVRKELPGVRKVFLEYTKLNRAGKRQFISMMNKRYGFDYQKYMTKMLNFNLDAFVRDNCVTMTVMLDKKDSIFKYISSHPIDFSGLDVADCDKLELYFADCFLRMAESEIPEEQKQDYLYYVSNFFFEHNDLLKSDLSINVGNVRGVKLAFQQSVNRDGIVVTPQSLYERYRNLLVANPNLRDIDFSHLDFNGMTPSEVKSFMDEYLKDLSANWDFLPPDATDIFEKAKGYIRNVGEGLSEEEKLQRQERLMDLFMEKKRLYDSSDPYFRIQGKGTFDGYIGYVYPNGRVVLDKFYEDSETGKLAEGQAIYAMDIQEFYELSRLSKSELIRNKLCNRYIHKGDWVNKVLENEINADTGKDPTVEVKNLVKSGSIVVPAGSVV